MLFIIVLCVAFTYPLIVNFDSSIYGFKQYDGDPLGTMWWMWWYRFAWSRHISSRFVDIVGYPFGLDRNSQPIAPLLNYPVAILNLFIRNEVLTYNIAVLGGIFLTALCMFFLVRYLTKSNLAGFLAGIIFGFCPNQLMHSAQHLGFTLNFWIVLYVLFLFKLKDMPCRRNLFLCAIFGACTVLTNYYYGYFMLIFTVVFLLFWRSKFKYFFWSGIIGFFILAPFVIPILLRHGEGVAFAHPIKDLFKYSAHWYDYFVPSEFHPIFGKWVQGLGRHYFERSLYLGYLPIVLGLWAMVKKKDSTVRFFGVTAVLFFVFSLPPVLFKIPNFSFFAYKLFPMFRVYARMGFLVIFSVAVLAGYGLAEMRLRRYAVCLFIAVILFEYLNFPPFHNVELSKVPYVYQWLAGEPEDTVVVEYPFVRSIDARHSEYVFYQRIHKKSLINGVREGTIGDAFRKACYYPDKIETARLLAYLGGDYMVVHKDGYSAADLENVDKNTGLELIRDFPEARIYRIVAKPDDLVMVYWNNFASWEKWDDGNYYRWLGNNATIWVGTREKRVVDMRFNILAFARERQLEVYVNDVLVRRLDVNAVSNPDLAQEIALRNILLQPGENIIRFYTPQGEDRIRDVLHNRDDRRVSFAISGVSVKEVR